MIFERRKRWLMAPCHGALLLRISQELNISPVLAQVLINRGLTSPEKAENFFNFSFSCLHSPLLLPGISRAVACIEHVLRDGEKILIYGDYDVDGITGTALLYLYFRSRGAQVEYYIPDRMEEGYGLNEDAVHWAGREKFALIVTVDCGISSCGEVALARSLGLKTIVTDHHQPPPILPGAEAVINPKLKGAEYPFPDLAGVAVAWKLAQALEIHRGSGSPDQLWLGEYLDLVCLGTIADVVSLTDENRVIAGLGLKAISSAGRPGLKALLTVAGLKDRPVSSGQVAFFLAPRLNAAGRLSSARLGVDLLTASDEGAALLWAAELDRENCRRQTLEGEIFRQAVTMVEETVDWEKELVLVLASPHWHPGVVGIVASRLVEKFHRPVVLIVMEEDLAKGSARSMEQFDIYAAFDHCRELLVQFGGHRLAAGLKLKTEDIGSFREKINDYARMVLHKVDLIPTIKIDLELEVDGREAIYAGEMERLSPFGQGNSCPVFALRNLKVVEAKAVGGSFAHLKLKLASGSHILDGIGFNLAHHLSWINQGEKLDLAVTLERSQWNGSERIQLLIKDIQPHPVFPLVAINSGEKNSPAELTGDPLAGEILPALNQGTGIGAVLPIHAGRAFWHKAAAYQHLVCGGRTVVLFSCPSQLWSEYNLARAALAEWGMAVGGGDSCLALEGKEYVWKAFTSGIVEVLLTTPEFLQSQENFPSVLAASLVIINLADPFDFLSPENQFIKRCGDLLRDYRVKGLLVSAIPNRKTDAEFLHKAFGCGKTYVNIEKVPLKLFDCRGANDRVDYIMDLVQKGESCLVYVAFRYQVHELVKQILDRGVPSSLVAGCHGSQRAWRHQMVRERIKQGTARVLVTTRHFGADPSGLFDQVVFFSPPRSMFDFSHFTGWPGAGPGPEIHLLFGPRDVELTERVLNTDFPDRELLAQVYRTVKAIFSSEKRISGTREEILRKLKNSGLNQGKEATTEAWLAIMAELGLIRIFRQGDGSCLELIDLGQKCVLEDSLRYREGLREKNAAGFCHHLALSDRIDEKMAQLL